MINNVLESEQQAGRKGCWQEEVLGLQSTKATTPDKQPLYVEPGLPRERRTWHCRAHIYSELDGED